MGDTLSVWIGKMFLSVCSGHARVLLVAYRVVPSSTSLRETTILLYIFGAYLWKEVAGKLTQRYLYCLKVAFGVFLQRTKAGASGTWTATHTTYSQLRSE